MNFEQQSVAGTDPLSNRMGSNETTTGTFRETDIPVVVSDEENNHPRSREKSSYNLLGQEASNHTVVESRRNTYIKSSLIIAVGLMGTVIFIVLGLRFEESKANDAFYKSATHLLEGFNEQINSLDLMASWVQQSFRGGQATREDMFRMARYLEDAGLDFDHDAIGFVPKVANADRARFENETRQYLEQTVPPIFVEAYVGIWDFPRDAPLESYIPEILSQNERPSLTRAPERDFYYPLHFAYPQAFDLVLDVDINSLSHVDQNFQIMLATNTSVVSTVNMIGGSKFIYYLHPGILPEDTGQNIAMLQLGIDGILRRLTRYQTSEDTTVFLFDSTNPDEEEFMGGMEIRTGSSDDETCHWGDSTCFVSQKRVVKGNDDILNVDGEDWTVEQILDLPGRKLEGRFSLPGERVWKMVVVSDSEAFEPYYGFVITMSIVIALVSIFTSVWFYMSTRRARKFQELQFLATQEQARVKFEAAQKRALAERELNDFIAHEVRNPLSAAISATNFVSSSIDGIENSHDLFNQKESVKEDIFIIQTSLSYVNELLRNMIDMHRITCDDTSKEFKLDMEYLDVKQDLFEPVVAMLYSRSTDFRVEIVCPEQLVIYSDRMRLKQIILNLSRNSQKFVTRGFLRLLAEVVEGTVKLAVEDSGPGIPESKRGPQLFTRYQESLDNLNQGTGIGLFVCHKLVKLLGGELYLDESYDSGVVGMPGARFVAKLNTLPCSKIEMASMDESQVLLQTGMDSVELPPSLSVLFVDDDMILRKLFARSMKKACPDWKVDLAASGEAALLMVADHDYDLIFMDMYMRSVEKSLLGSETVKAMRAKGVTSIICGLSANEMESVFLANGANTFYLKPFPCKMGEIQEALAMLLRFRQ